MTQEELINKFNTTESVIRTNFPKFCAAQLKKGYLITRKGHYPNAQYFVEEVEPEIRDSSEFSETKKREVEELPNEKWLPCTISADYEVSNLGRFRKSITKEIINGSLSHGYVRVYINGNTYSLHRLIMQAFNPIDNDEFKVVDHINGKRQDNRVENLRWVEEKENIILMSTHRAELNKELTRIINKIGYEETLEMLKQL